MNRRRFLDVQFFKMDMADPKSKVARKLTATEQAAVLAERSKLLAACILSPASPPKAAFLYNPKEAAAMTGGPAERARALQTQ